MRQQRSKVLVSGYPVSDLIVFVLVVVQGAACATPSSIIVQPTTIQGTYTERQTDRQTDR